MITTRAPDGANNGAADVRQFLDSQTLMARVAPIGSVIGHFLDPRLQRIVFANGTSCAESPKCGLIF